MSKKNHPPPYFEMNPSIIFSETSMMETKSEKWDYIASMMKAWVDMDIDNMPYWMVENLGRLRDVSEIRARSALMRWKPLEINSNGMQMHSKCIANALQNDANGMQPSLLLSSSSKNKKYYALDSVQYRIAMSMDEMQKDHYGDSWKSRTPAQLHGWADAIDKMHRIDKIKYSMIWGWYSACFADPFWKNNIQSPEKLRKQISENKLIKLLSEAEEYAHLPYDEEQNESTD